MNVTNGFTSMEQIRHRMQTTDSQRQVKKQNRADKYGIV